MLTLRITETHNHIPETITCLNPLKKTAKERTPLAHKIFVGD